MQSLEAGRGGSTAPLGRCVGIRQGREASQRRLGTGEEELIRRDSPLQSAQNVACGGPRQGH